MRSQQLVSERVHPAMTIDETPTSTPRVDTVPAQAEVEQLAASNYSMLLLRERSNEVNGILGGHMTP
jgi:hypothetical protein